MKDSSFGFYSVGIVAKNKPLDTRIVEITPVEHLPFLSGELTDNATSYKASGTAQDSSAYQVDVDSAATVKATWLPIGSSNRTTAPDVRRGEVVILYRFADTDEFWWATLKDDAQLRKLETVIYAFSGTRDEAAKPDATNTYFLEISTHQKLVTFHTSKADGEPFTYDIQLNTKDGQFSLRDDIGNVISLDSKERQLEMINPDGSHLDINKENISFTCVDTISLKANKIVSNAADSITSTTQTMTDTVSTLAQSAQTAALQAGSYNLEAGSMNGSAGDGDLVIGGISVKHHHHDDGLEFFTSEPKSS